MRSAQLPCLIVVACVAILIITISPGESLPAQQSGIVTRIPDSIPAHLGDTLRVPVSIFNFAGAIAGFGVEYLLDRPGLAVLDDATLFDTSGAFTSGWEHLSAFKPSATDVRITGIADVNFDHTPSPYTGLSGTIVSIVLRIPCDADTLSGTSVFLAPNGAQDFSDPQGTLMSPVSAYGGRVYVSSPARGDFNYSGTHDVADVVSEINCAFRGNCPNCASLIADLDCDGDSDIIDVVLLIGVAFRGETLTTCP